LSFVLKIPQREVSGVIAGDISDISGIEIARAKALWAIEDEQFLKRLSKTAVPCQLNMFSRSKSYSHPLCCLNE